ncbi:MAG: cytochrome-c peroxidase [Acidobacteria bacterium]|nr:cytochrome-c peroxidase [Acidobacteriota bacterium]
MRFLPRFAWVLCVMSCTVLAADGLPARARSRGTELPPASKGIPTGKTIPLPSALGLPPVSYPGNNPPTAETVALGRKLFFDPILSRDNSISCASCHDPEAAFSDARRFSPGVGEQLGNRQAMTILNAVYHQTQFWDGRSLTLEQQAEGPIQNPIEMASSLTGVERKLAASPEYVALFAQAFGPGRITYPLVTKALAAYERTLVSGNSPFDRYYYGGDKTAMSESAIRGMKFFMDRTLESPNCISCHNINEAFATFTEPRFHNTGVAYDTATGAFQDLGRTLVTEERKDTGAFKVVTLRNIALTAPYMHDGSMKTLEEVVDFYLDGGRHNQFLSGVMPHLPLTFVPKEQIPQAKKDLVEFLKALTGEMPKDAVPPSHKPQSQASKPALKAKR